MPLFLQHDTERVNINTAVYCRSASDSMVITCFILIIIYYSLTHVLTVRSLTRCSSESRHVVTICELPAISSYVTSAYQALVMMAQFYLSYLRARNLEHSISH